MTHQRLAFWLESVLAVVSGALAALTLFWAEWIEAVFGVDPDHHNGAAEWIVVCVCLALTVGCSILARAEWRRLRAGEA